MVRLAPYCWPASKEHRQIAPATTAGATSMLTESATEKDARK